jgi:hypothetical protein
MRADETALRQARMLIGGQWVDSAAGEVLEVRIRHIGAVAARRAQAMPAALNRELMMRGCFVAKAHNRVRSIPNGKEAGLCRRQHDHKIKNATCVDRNGHRRSAGPIMLASILRPKKYRRRLRTGRQEEK